MAKLAPEIPISAVRKALRNSRRATFTSFPMSGSWGSPVTLVNKSATSWRDRWMAGMTMWDGPSWRSWMIHSPRSVSTTSKPSAFQVVVEEGLLRGHGLGFDDLLDPVVPGDGGDDLVGLPGGGGQMHLDPGGFGLGLEGLIQLFQVGQGLIFALGDLPAQAPARPRPERPGPGPPCKPPAKVPMAERRNLLSRAFFKRFLYSLRFWAVSIMIPGPLK